MSNFEVRDKIGQGGMGVVYRAHHLSLDLDVAVKFLHPHMADNVDAVRRFLQEARLAAKIKHPNVVQIYDTGRDERGRAYIVMEYLEGESLRSRIQRGRIAEGESVAILAQMLEGLDEAHRVGVVHRDIKPANVFLSRQGRVKIVDFGIAKAIGGASLTGTGTHIGTPEYMSPEQADGSPVDARSDLYNAGLVLFEMLTGKVPFKGSTPVSTLYMQVHQPPPPVPGVSRTVGAALARALAKSPAERFQTAADMRARLYRSGRTPRTALPLEPVKRGVARHNRLDRRIWLGAAAVLALAAGLVLLRTLTAGGHSAATKAAGADVSQPVTPGGPLVATKATGVDLSLRVPLGAKYKVERKRTVDFGNQRLFSIEERGLYTCDGVLHWKTSLENSSLTVSGVTRAIPNQQGFASWATQSSANTLSWIAPPPSVQTTSAVVGKDLPLPAGFDWLGPTTWRLARLGGPLAFETAAPTPHAGGCVLESNYRDYLTKQGIAKLPVDGWTIRQADWLIDPATGILLLSQVDERNSAGYRIIGYARMERAAESESNGK